MTLFKPSGNCQGKRESSLWSAAMTRRLIKGKSSYGINESRDTVSLALLRPPHEGGSVRVSAQTRATREHCYCEITGEKGARLQGCKPDDESQRRQRNEPMSNVFLVGLIAFSDLRRGSENANGTGMSIVFAGHLSAGCDRQETLTLRTGCRNQELRTNMHGISGSASIYLSHSTNFDSIRSTTLSLALDSFDKYL
jgi:hypothetical protein